MGGTMRPGLGTPLGTAEVPSAGRIVPGMELLGDGLEREWRGLASRPENKEALGRWSAADARQAGLG
jgi:hypothetical protein